ncbi:unnamed protein product [Allacma fusca]|uniref:PHTF1/2 N-terminal domain-containing protein n=1 Tax=Allacma fusca TaxID=39272 RepID=A0A8J2LKV1_9HEXA|nr:unnamed protein product [Allacma fusca]
MPSIDDLNSVLTWYQNYVGTFDKAKWEQTVEERILHGINHIPKKSAKVQSELIDLDLVRGSSFPKVKPKHGLFATARLALIRFLFLPIFHKWWSAQTSPRLFLVFLFLYGLQVGNVFLYLNSGATSQVTLNRTTETSEQSYRPTREDIPKEPTQPSGIQSSEIISPIILMVALTILHSQIVATHGCKDDEDVKSKGKGRRGSTGLKNRKRRITGRVLPSRRRSSLLNGANANLASAAAPTSIRKTISLSAKHSKDKVLISSSSIKKVIFEDESKSLSSNSDKDEGIADEISENLSVENDDNEDCVFEQKDTLQNEVSQIQAHLHASLQKVKSAVVLLGNMQTVVHEYVSIKDGDSEKNPEATIVTEDADHHKFAPQRLESVTIAQAVTTAPAKTQTSSLRKRNVSKQSEASSVSCGELSSNNNDSSTDEDIGEETMEDEEMRNKSEWTAVTTNSEDDDYGDEMNNSDDEDFEEETFEVQMNDHPFAWEFQQMQHSSKCLNINPSCVSSDKVSCTVWEGNEAKKADLGVLDICSTIIAKVECARENSDYLNLGICFSFAIAILPSCWRLNTNLEIDHFDVSKAGQYISNGIHYAYGDNLKVRVMILISILERLFLAMFAFFLLAVAEKTYKQRFLFAKLFSRITSFRKAGKSGIPHFRLNKVSNIKTWLSVRSYLQRRGPQRSVDIIVSATFIATFILIFFFSVELLKDSNRMYYLYNVEVMAWSMCLGIFLMRFMTLSSRISQKYRNLSVIITEQLNLYLKMEQKPHKKEELMVANNVLKLASELLKELEDPFKISSFASNPYLYNVTRIVILSAFSGVLSEMLGFKLKLYNIKIKRGYYTYGINKKLKHSDYEVFYGWNQVDFNFQDSSTTREDMIQSKKFIQENNIITALKISGSRMFLSTPRYKPGVPSTLNFVPYNGILGNGTGPALSPYPSWDMQAIGNCSTLQSVQAMEIDQYDRMWILDIGRLNLFSDQPINACPPKIVLVDLRRDIVLHTYTFPNDVITPTDGFPKDVAVACSSHTKCILYIADITEARLVLYDHEKQSSWFVTHPSMKPDPTATNITILGKTYYNPFGISSIGLAPRRQNHDTFYYAALASLTVYKVKTKVLLNAGQGSTLPEGAVVKVVTRPSQSDGMTMDASGRLYYGSLQHNSVYSFNTKRNSGNKPRLLAHSDIDIVWQDTFGFDNERGYLFLIADRFQFFEDQAYNFKEVNFRALRFRTGSKSYIYPA